MSLSIVLAVRQVTTESECFDDFQFSLIHSNQVEDYVPQENATSICIENGVGELAPVVSLSQFIRAQFLKEQVVLNSNNFSSDGFWIGLKDFDEVLGRTDPFRFNVTVGDDLNKTFYDTRGQLPWANNEPNTNSNRCVATNQNGFWADANCDALLFDILCTKECSDEDSNVAVVAISISVVALFLFILVIIATVFQQKHMKQLENDIYSHSLIVSKVLE